MRTVKIEKFEDGVKVESIEKNIFLASEITCEKTINKIFNNNYEYMSDNMNFELEYLIQYISETLKENFIEVLPKNINFYDERGCGLYDIFIDEIYDIDKVSIVKNSNLSDKEKRSILRTLKLLSDYIDENYEFAISWHIKNIKEVKLSLNEYDRKDDKFYRRILSHLETVEDLINSIYEDTISKVESLARQSHDYVYSWESLSESLDANDVYYTEEGVRFDY